MDRKKTTVPNAKAAPPSNNGSAKHASVQPITITFAATDAPHRATGRTSKTENWDEIFTHTEPWLVEKIDETAASWRWRVPLEKIQDSVYSPEFGFPGRVWRFLILDRKTNNNNERMMSLFLDCPEIKKRAPTFTLHAHFKLTVCGKIKSEVQITDHTYSPKEVDWGFAHMMVLSKLKNPEAGFIHERATPHIPVAGVCYGADDAPPAECHERHPSVLVEVTIKDNSITPTIPIKDPIRCVGLRNQGQTCYLNSLLQALFHLSLFRKIVYRMPTEEEHRALSEVAPSPQTPGVPAAEKKTMSIPLALQRLFYQLQYSTEDAVKTRELTRSFGWTQADTWDQHDIHEVNRLLVENLENKMKHTEMEAKLKKLFVGHVDSFIRCTEVSYTSSKTEEFYDINLCVSGCTNLYDSFRKDLEVDRMDGENCVSTDSFGLQPAEKGIQYLDFPDVLQLHLKRFEYDRQNFNLVKVDDWYEFYEEINLSEFVKDNSNPDDNIFQLYGVLVHSGGAGGGHYYSYINVPQKDAQLQWYKFDDERVTVCPKDTVLSDNFGGKEPVKFWLPNASMTTAYMLVYVRKNIASTVVFPFKDEDTPEHLKDIVSKEEADRQRLLKDKEEEHLHFKFRIITEESFREYDQRSYHMDLVDFDHESIARNNLIRIKRTLTWGDLKKEVESKFGVPTNCQRFWKWCWRTNKTKRLDCLVKSYHGSKHPVTDAALLKDIWASINPVDLYLETVQNPADFVPITSDSIFLFFKSYDPATSKVEYRGSMVVKAKDLKFKSVIPFCNRLIGQKDNAPLQFYEEVRPTMILPIDVELSFKEIELDTGDIIVFQPRNYATDGEPAPASGAYRYPTVSEIFHYIDRRGLVRFFNIKAPKDAGPACTLELSKQDRFEEVQAKLGANIQQPAANIQFYASVAGQPNTRPLSMDQRKTLQDMLDAPIHLMGAAAPKPGQSPVLFYEVLDMPVAEWETKSRITVQLMEKHVRPEKVLEQLVDKDTTVADIVAEVSRAEPDRFRKGQPVQCVRIHNCMIVEVLQPENTISSLLRNDKAFNMGSGMPYSPPWFLRLEDAPVQWPGPTAASVLPDQRLVHVVHQDSVTRVWFGEPFLFYVVAAWPCELLKVHIREYLGIREDEFKRWGVSLNTIVNGQPTSRVLEDSKTWADICPPESADATWHSTARRPQHTIVLEHKDLTRRKVQEKALKIHN